MRILLWSVHGSYTDALIRGDHEYLLPFTPEGGPFTTGRGAYGAHWPANVVDAPIRSLSEAEVDAVILQRPEEIDLATQWLGRRPGRDVPAVFLEHNTPKGQAVTSRHPLAEQSAIPIVHVTHFNELIWDCGEASTLVIEHGIVDPGHLYTGELPHLVAVINEPVRRERIVGSDLLARFADVARVDLFGIDGDLLAPHLGLGPDRLAHIGDVPLARLHPLVAQRRVYVHPNRWTSLGLALLEAMHLGMPVVALAATEAARAVPPEAGAISTDVGELVDAARHLVADPDEARRRGAVAREFALARYGLGRFLADWDTVLHDVTSRRLAA